MELMEPPQRTAGDARTPVPTGMSSAAAQYADGRFLMLDGLRGVAAMMVVLYHLHDAIEESVRSWIPPALDLVLRNGNLGVDIFFVLSGFAIAHSVRNGKYTLGYLGRFALRRSIRLDPPLWVTIAVELLLVKIALRFYPDLGTPMPSLGQVLANVTYLQELIGSRDIVPVFWSLTYEVQFYLVTVLSLVIGLKLSQRGLPARWRTIGGTALAALLFGYSALIFLNFLATPKAGLFIIRWFQFFLGVLAWAAVTRRIPVRTFMGAWVAVVAVIACSHSTPYRISATCAALMTSAFLVWAGSSGRMSTILAGSYAQFLGRISYSLYLLHEVVGWRFIALCKRLLGTQLSPLNATIVFVAGIALSIISAWIMYRLVEAPSMRLARLVKLETRDALVRDARPPTTPAFSPARSRRTLDGAAV
jgi:peptidoglycan/LPS O-acetylase OafA/YrhL